MPQRQLGQVAVRWRDARGQSCLDPWSIWSSASSHSIKRSLIMFSTARFTRLKYLSNER